MKPNVEAVLRHHGLNDLAEMEFARLGYPRHIDYDPETGEAIAIVCRGCGTKIAGWVDHDVAEQSVDKVDRNNIVTKILVRQAFKRLGPCFQLRMLLDDNALYEPLVCRECARRVDEQMAQELYRSDLVEMVSQAMALGKDPDRTINVVKVLARRHVRSW